MSGIPIAEERVLARGVIAQAREAHQVARAARGEVHQRYQAMSRRWHGLQTFGQPSARLTSGAEAHMTAVALVDAKDQQAHELREVTAEMDLLEGLLRQREQEEERCRQSLAGLIARANALERNLPTLRQEAEWLARQAQAAEHEAAQWLERARKRQVEADVAARQLERAQRDLAALGSDEERTDV